MEALILLDKNEAILLNEIVYKIHCSESFDDMRVSVLTLLKMLIPYNKATFYLTSSSPDHSLCEPVGVNILPTECQQYSDEFESIDYTRWMFNSSKSMAFRETDLFPESTRELDDYYKGMYQKNGIHFSAMLTIGYMNHFLGVISLYRGKEDDDFTDRDLFILELIKDHLAIRLQQKLFPENKDDDRLKGKRQQITSQIISKYHLTIRESEILLLLLEGIEKSTICETLVISAFTLKKHSSNIYRKLGISSRWQLMNIEL